jgi:dienelactone hydrolase
MSLAVAVVGLVVSACGSAGPAPAADDATETTALPRPVAFDHVSLDLFDPDRATEEGSATPASDGRHLATEVYLPREGGARPLIVFSHGLSGHPRKFSQLLSAWAAAGYVVAAPAFPLTNDRVPGNAANWRSVAAQPGDVSFVISEVLRLASGSDGPLSGRVDPQRVGTAGLSLGGATTYGVAFNSCCRDDRVRAVEVFSGALLPVGVPTPGTFELDGHVPLLIVHGTEDRSLPYDLARQAYGSATAPVWLVTLVGGTHAPPFEDDPSPFDATVERITTEFWDGTLGDDAGALDRLATDAAVPGLTTVEARRP